MGYIHRIEIKKHSKPFKFLNQNISLCREICGKYLCNEHLILITEAPDQNDSISKF